MMSHQRASSAGNTTLAVARQPSPKGTAASIDISQPMIVVEQRAGAAFAYSAFNVSTGSIADARRAGK